MVQRVHWVPAAYSAVAQATQDFLSEEINSLAPQLASHLVLSDEIYYPVGQTVKQRVLSEEMYSPVAHYATQVYKLEAK